MTFLALGYLGHAKGIVQVIVLLARQIRYQALVPVNQMPKL